MRAVLNTVFGLMLAAAVADAGAQGAPQKIAGEVVRYDAGTVQIRTPTNAQATASITDRTRISVRMRSAISEVRSGSFVGVTAAPGADGTLVASVIHIFPENMRGTGEGHRPMSGADTMTNATVSGISGKGASSTSMTNAAVRGVAGMEGDLRLTLTYNSGTQAVIVPRGIPVMTTDVGDPSLLAPGAHVIVYAGKQQDGLIVAGVSVGKDGYVPAI